MSHPLFTADIRGQMILLGTGTSVGVPAIGCGCDVCRSENPRNRRTRSSAILGLPEGNLLIDTSPDLREQLLRERVGIVHAVLYTHEHADHVFGLDDLRLMQFHLGGPVPLYSDLLLHDLGPALDDAVVQGQATGRHWRTTPLWGLRMRSRFLHDARAETLSVAITAHGGEAATHAARFRTLSEAEREALLAFLGDL